MTEEKKSSLPYQAWLMLAMVLGVIIAGFLVFPGDSGQRDRLLGFLGTTNQGTLLAPPQPLSGLNLVTEDGQPWRASGQDLTWRLLIPGGARCLDACRDMLYVTRQMHVLLSKQAHRLERIYVNLDGGALVPETAEYLANEQPHLTQLVADRMVFARWLKNTNAGWGAGTIRAFLVDYRGNAMLFYTPEHTGSQMLEDIKHLLKYSPE